MKPYPSAHNHVAIGEVLDETPQYLKMLCKTYHFGSNISGRKGTILQQGKYICGVLEGEKVVRIIPWNKIEVINELPDNTEWDVTAQVDQSGLCYLINAHKTVITRPSGRDV